MPKSLDVILSNQLFPTENITFAEKLQQIQKNIAQLSSGDELLEASKQLINFANAVEAYFEVLNQDQIVWKEEQIIIPSHTTVNPVNVVSSSVAPPPAPPPPPPPPPSRLGKVKRVLPNVSVELRENKDALLNLFSHSSFVNRERFNENVRKLIYSRKKCVELLLNNNANLGSFNLKQPNNDNQIFIPITLIMNFLITLISEGVIDKDSARNILVEFKNRFLFASFDKFKTIMKDLLDQRDSVIIEQAFGQIRTRTLTVKNFCDNYEQYIEKQKILLGVEEDLTKKLQYIEDSKILDNDMPQESTAIKEALDFLKTEGSFIADTYIQQIIYLKFINKEKIREKEYFEYVKKISEKIKSSTKNSTIVKKQGNDRELRLDFFKQQMCRGQLSTLVKNKIKDLKENGGIFKSCLTVKEYSQFLKNVKEYFTDPENMKKLALVEQQTFSKTIYITDAESCYGIENLIEELATANKIDLIVIERELLGLPGEEHLFDITQNGISFEVNERKVLLEQQAAYQLNMAELAYERNNYLAENIQDFLQNKFVTDFFTEQEINKLIELLNIKDDIGLLQYDDKNFNARITEALVKFCSATQPRFVELIPKNLDHKQIYPICLIENLLEDKRLFVSKKRPYSIQELPDLKISARKTIQHKAAKQQEITKKTSVNENMPTISSTATKILFDFSIMKKLHDEVQNPEITTVVVGQNFKQVFDNFCEKQSKTIIHHRDLTKQFEKDGDVELNITKIDKQFNELSMYHNLSTKKHQEGNKFSIVETDLENKEREVINICYQEIKKDKKHISENLIKIQSTKLDNNTKELDDKACLMMVLSAKELSKSKKIDIDNCEDKPETAIKLFLFSIILGLKPKMSKDTISAIDSITKDSLLPLQQCFLKVYNDPKLEPNKVLEIVNQAWSNLATKTTKLNS